ERFDIRADLAKCLRCAVKLALVEVKTTHQCHHCAILRINGNQCRVNFRYLCQPPGIAHLTDPDLLARLHYVSHFTWCGALLCIGTVRTRPTYTFHFQRNR